ncbi:ABC transporter permease, partial [Calidithermus terrae]|uniref:ABC transporter permease n=1 Tax=Calidithermus terrae TaxID=1408545 RepID=UPI000E65B92C
MSRPAGRALNPVAWLAAGLGLLALALPWIAFKPNRLLDGALVRPWGLEPALAAAMALGWLLLPLLRGAAYPLLLGLLTLGWALLAGGVARGVLEGQPEVARAGLAAGFWLTLLALYAAAVGTPVPARRWLAGTLPAAVLVAALAGSFSPLAPVVEGSAYRQQFGLEAWRHLAMAASAVGQALLVGIPLGALAARDARFGWVLSLTGFLQTIPSLALFGLLLPVLARVGQGVSLEAALAVVGVGLLLTRLFWAASPSLGLLAAFPVGLLALVLGGTLLFNLLGPEPLRLELSQPLAAAGVRGIGAAPAVLALTLYALLPVVLSTYTGLRAVPEAARDAGKGMGMSRRQLFWRVELPLATPLILEGVRGALVLTIGITTVAALIG